MGATKIMVIRHAEKPDRYKGAQYAGVNNLGAVAGGDGAKHLVTLGWERAGALVALFAPPGGPEEPIGDAEIPVRLQPDRQARGRGQR